MFQDKISASAPAPQAEPHAGPEQERRTSERYVTVLKVGRAVVEGQEQLCVVRNMSRDGAKLELLHAPALNQRLTLELRSDKVVNGTVRWADQRSAGIEFDHQIDVHDMLQNRSSRSILRILPRSPRFAASAHTHIEQDESLINGELINISLHGLCIETSAKPVLDTNVVVRVAGLPPRRASIRWASRGKAGVYFDMPISFTELANWLEEHQPA